MIRDVILDTGPLVAFLHATDHHHDWATNVLKKIEVPLMTCDAVVSEACFLLGRWPHAVEKIGTMLNSRVLQVPFSLTEESPRVFALMKRYANVPMSFADACLVSLSEHNERSRILTLDSDFEIYRRHGRRKIPLLAPWSDA